MKILTHIDACLPGLSFTHKQLVDAGKIQRVDLDNNELQLKNITLPIGATYKNLLLSRIRKLG